MSNIHEEEALGKAYDSRLMKRLLRVHAAVQMACDSRLGLGRSRYSAGTGAAGSFLQGHRRISGAWRRPRRRYGEWPSTASLWISLVYLLVLAFDFLAQYIQIRIMQRVGQQTMYDMRTEIFGRLQRLPMSYFDRNPVGRLMTRVTTDVDALNDLFAAGVVTMINDFFLLVVMAVIAVSSSTQACARRSRRAAVHPHGHAGLPQDTCARRTARSARPSPGSTPSCRNIFPG